MKTFAKLTLALVALGASIALAPVLHAQSNPPPSAPSQGMMGGMGSGGTSSGDMGGMAGMMKMMEDCNRMMQSKNQNPHTPLQSPPASPEQKG